MEFSWQSMKKLLNIRSDILLTFMHRTCWRTFCTNEVTGNGHKALTNFLEMNLGKMQQMKKI